MPLPRSWYSSMRGRGASVASGVSGSSGGEHEVGVRLRSRAPDAALELVELGQAETLRVLNDERVGVRVVDAALDDRGGHGRVDLVLRSERAASRPRPRARSSCRAPRPRAPPGRPPRYALGPRRRRMVVHAVGDVVDLARSARARAGWRRATTSGSHSPTVHTRPGRRAGRGRGDEAHVAHAAHGHLHGARDRRRGERQHVDLLAHVLELLLVLHAKALLLVDRSTRPRS